MNIDKTKLMIGAAMLTLGIILVAPALADTEDEQPHMLQLYFFDEETGEYKPWYPRWYNPENSDSFTPLDECPWWDNHGDGKFNWMIHWGRKWTDPEDSWRHGYGKGGCGGYGRRSNNARV
jgi:hypothetical protein